jgi:putative PIN family toxin of toxin-antitoxin system
MRVVIDTNVLVSALLNPYGVPASVLVLVLEEQITVVFDAQVLAEYEEVLLRPKFAFDIAHVRSIIEFLKETADAVPALPSTLKIKDPDDLPFALTATNSDAQYLITGNVTHFPRELGNARVVTPREFLQLYLKNRQ